MDGASIIIENRMTQKLAVHERINGWLNGLVVWQAVSLLLASILSKGHVQILLWLNMISIFLWAGWIFAKVLPTWILQRIPNTAVKWRTRWGRRLLKRMSWSASVAHYSCATTTMGRQSREDMSLLLRQMILHIFGYLQGWFECFGHRGTSSSSSSHPRDNTHGSRNTTSSLELTSGYNIMRPLPYVYAPGRQVLDRGNEAMVPPDEPVIKSKRNWTEKNL